MKENQSNPLLGELKITNSYLAANQLYDELHDLDHEESWVLFLTSANTPILKKMMTCGTLSAAPLDSRRIVKEAILCDAAGVILFHNHPSGDCHPGTADITGTEKLRQCCDLFNISLLDHIIITAKKFFSFAEESSNTYKK